MFHFKDKPRERLQARYFAEEKLVVKAMKTITDKKGGSMPTGAFLILFERNLPEITSNLSINHFKTVKYVQGINSTRPASAATYQ